MATKPNALTALVANKNRHLRGDTNEIKGKIDSNVVVRVGDLMILDASNTGGQQSSNTFKAFPASWVKSCTHTHFETNFIGVAMQSSLSGVTEDIPIATTGIFRFPVSPSAGQTVSTGYIVSGATYGASGTSVFTQKVTCEPASAVDNTDARIGMVIRGQTLGTTVDFQLLTRFTGVTQGIWPVA